MGEEKNREKHLAKGVFFGSISKRSPQVNCCSEGFFSMPWIAVGCLELLPARIAGSALHVCKLISKTPWNLPGNKTPKSNQATGMNLGLFIPALIKKDNLSCHGEGSLSLKEKSKHALERRVSHIPEHLSLDGIIVPCQENCFVTKYQPLGDRMGQKPSIRTMPRRRWYQGDYPKFTLAPEDPGKLSVCL